MAFNEPDHCAGHAGSIGNFNDREAALVPCRADQVAEVGRVV